MALKFIFSETFAGVRFKVNLDSAVESDFNHTGSPPAVPGLANHHLWSWFQTPKTLSGFGPSFLSLHVKRTEK